MSPPADDLGGYARLIRACPYGPREVSVAGVAGGSVTAWFHGPFAVLTVTDPAGVAVTVRAASEGAAVVHDDDGDEREGDGESGGSGGGNSGGAPGADLASLFAAAGRGHAARLGRPDRLVCERPLDSLGRLVAPRVHDLALRPAPVGTLVSLTWSGPAAEPTGPGRVTGPGRDTAPGASGGETPAGRDDRSVRTVGTVLDPPGITRLAEAIDTWAQATRR